MESTSEWRRKNTPYLWAEDNPGKHRLGIYGQQSADGWHCWACGWMNSNPSMSFEEAKEAHGEPKFGEWWEKN